MNKHFVMEYLYRDANNFKAFGQLLLTGEGGESHSSEIKSSLYSGEYFVAEQVAIPPLYDQLWKYSNGPTTADHAFHEFLELRSATDEEVAILEVWGDITTLISRFHHVRQGWDCRLSIHCSGF